jgi:hypothetical protein
LGFFSEKREGVRRGKGGFRRGGFLFSFSFLSTMGIYKKSEAVYNEGSLFLSI